MQGRGKEGGREAARQHDSLGAGAEPTNSRSSSPASRFGQSVGQDLTCICPGRARHTPRTAAARRPASASAARAAHVLAAGATGSFPPPASATSAPDGVARPPSSTAFNCRWQPAARPVGAAGRSLAAPSRSAAAPWPRPPSRPAARPLHRCFLRPHHLLQHAHAANAESPPIRLGHVPPRSGHVPPVMCRRGL